MSNQSTDVAYVLGAEGMDRRAAAIREEQERDELRRSRIDGLTSVTATAEERIRRWEDLHALALPRAANHKLVAVIARDTTLSVEQVQEEQQRRANPVASTQE